MLGWDGWDGAFFFFLPRTWKSNYLDRRCVGWMGWQRKKKGKICEVRASCCGTIAYRYTPPACRQEKKERRTEEDFFSFSFLPHLVGRVSPSMPVMKFSVYTPSCVGNDDKKCYPYLLVLPLSVPPTTGGKSRPFEHFIGKPSLAPFWRRSVSRADYFCPIFVSARHTTMVVASITPGSK